MKYTHKQRVPIKVKAIHVFALATCDAYLQASGEENITFHGTTTWMNPYGHLTGDAYGYLPFYEQ